MASMGGWKIFTTNGGEARNGGLVLKWGDEKFSSFFFHSWQKGVNPTIMWRPPYIAYPPPLFPILSNSTPTALPVVLFLWLNEWSCHIRCTILLNDNMDLHMSSLGTAVPEGPWCVFFATRHQVYWGMTHHVFFTCTLIWYHTHKHTNTHSTLRGQ